MFTPFLDISCECLLLFCTFYVGVYAGFTHFMWVFTPILHGKGRVLLQPLLPLNGCVYVYVAFLMLVFWPSYYLGYLINELNFYKNKAFKQGALPILSD